MAYHPKWMLKGVYDKNEDNIVDTLWAVTSVSANYTASNGEIVLVDASAAAVTITLPSPSAGARVRVKKIDASINAVTVAPSATETIDGAASHSIASQWEEYEYVSDGTNWYVF